MLENTPFHQPRKKKTKPDGTWLVGLGFGLGKLDALLQGRLRHGKAVMIRELLHRKLTDNEKVTEISFFFRGDPNYKSTCQLDFMVTTKYLDPSKSTVTAFSTMAALAASTTKHSLSSSGDSDRPVKKAKKSKSLEEQVCLLVGCCWFVDCLVAYGGKGGLGEEEGGARSARFGI